MQDFFQPPYETGVFYCFLQQNIGEFFTSSSSWMLFAKIFSAPRIFQFPGDNHCWGHANSVVAGYDVPSWVRSWGTLVHDPHGSPCSHVWWGCSGRLHGGFHSHGVPPIAGWFVRDPTKMDDLGVPLFQQTTTCLRFIRFINTSFNFRYCGTGWSCLLQYTALPENSC